MLTICMWTRLLRIANNTWGELNVDRDDIMMRMTTDETMIEYNRDELRRIY